MASSAEEALRGRRHPSGRNWSVMDVRLPGMDGLSAMKELTARLGPIPIVVITAFGNLETAVTAVQNGAFDYLPKPFDLEQATTVIERALAVGDPRPRPRSPNWPPARPTNCWAPARPCRTSSSASPWSPPAIARC